MLTGLKPFRSVSIAYFTGLFAHSNPEVIANKRNRFVNFLRATADGTFFERPSVDPPYVAHIEYVSPPMWNVTQSSYEDVEAELNLMRGQHLDKRILFVGGDGLSIIRMNHLLHQHHELYLDSAPLIIPVQGEAPHGVFHVMHGGWRLFQKFIRAAANATLGMHMSSAVMDDPDVKHFNNQYFALCWMTRACAEYVLHLSQTSGAIDIDLVPEFISACERNVDLGFVVHFLYDFAFLVFDFKQGVRANRSKHLDLLWREFYSVGKTSTANKTHYVPMAVMRVFWGEALSPPLAHLYHNLRAIPMSKRVYVGWDTPIEWLNGAITEGVSRMVSENRIAKFIHNYAFLDSNYHFLRESTDRARSGRALFKDLDANVDVMKGWLMRTVGSDWNSATQANVNPKIDFGRGGPGTLPWDEIRDAMNRQGRHAVDTHVAQCVRGLTSGFYGFDP